MGKLVMATLPQKSVEEKIRFVTEVYVGPWKGKINSVFLHSKITHISVSGKPAVQRARSLAYYLGLLEMKKDKPRGYCRICAQEGIVIEAARHNYPLAGSGEFVNFHHCHEPGLLLCRECLISLFFVPMGILQCSDNLMMLQVQNGYTEQLWQDEMIRENLDKIYRGSSVGILKSTYVNHRNALFYFAARLVEKFDSSDVPVQPLRLLCFNNFGPKPDVQILDLPNPVFAFLKRVLIKADLKTDWLRFVKRHYRFGKSTQFDEKDEEWHAVKKKESVRLDIKDYAGINSNRVHDYLLTGKSILALLCRMHRSTKFPIMIAITYLREVRQMRQEQIDLIRRIADKIIIMAQTEGNYKKFLNPVEGARYAHQLRFAILKLIKVHYKNGESEPFIRLADYVDYLFPDGQSWYETRDLMLICLYEKLHDLRVEPAAVSDEAIVDVVEQGNGDADDFNQED